MLSSRYAPIVALTVLAVIIVGALGWFLAIKPQVDDRGDIASTTDEVRANTEAIALASAQIDSFAAALEETTDYSGAIALNAPSTFDMQAIRARIASAISSAGAEVVTVEQATSTDVEGWEMPSGSLESDRVAALFQTGPVHPEATEEVFTPAVTPVSTDEGGAQIWAVPVMVTVAGGSQEVLDVLDILEDPDQQIFQVHTVEFTARPDTSSSIAGVSDPATGDAILEFSGFFYLHEPDLEIVDTGTLGDGSLGGATPFEPIEGGENQPGAN
ncbi:hypothetical protein [Demequina aestuarii]|uniref:hypothetical protein n=1 Tax=Demequina aestuarii TaxID=327095 RepID=UPI00078151C1|nr:hypothetical protein [Demequina aestuarii]